MMQTGLDFHSFTSCADVSAAVHGSRTACSSARIRDRSRGSACASCAKPATASRSHALMQNAREEAEALLAADPTLAGYPILLDRVQRMFAEQNDEAFN